MEIRSRILRRLDNEISELEKENDLLKYMVQEAKDQYSTLLQQCSDHGMNMTSILTQVTINARKGWTTEEQNAALSI